MAKRSKSKSNIVVEGMLLRGAIQSPEVRGEVLDRLRIEHLTSPGRRSILEAVRSLDDGGMEVSFDTVLAKLDSLNGNRDWMREIEEVEGDGSIITPVLAQTLIRFPVERHANDSLLEVMREAIGQLSSGSASLEMALGLRSAIDAWENVRVGGAKALSSADTQHPDRDIPLPWPSLDSVAKLRRGQLVVVSGYTGYGKTRALWNMLLHAAKVGKTVVLHSLEMSREEVVPCLLAIESGVSSDKIKAESFSGDEELRVKRARLVMDRVLSERFLIDDRPEVGVGDVAHTARRYRADVVAVDYLQLLAGVSESPQSLDSACKALKVSAAKLDSCLILVSQVHRSQEATKNARPTIHASKGGSIIEQSAGLYLMFHRQGSTPDVAVASKRCEITIAKQRHGESGRTVSFDFDGATSRITEVKEK